MTRDQTVNLLSDLIDLLESDSIPNKIEADLTKILLGILWSPGMSSIQVKHAHKLLVEMSPISFI